MPAALLLPLVPPPNAPPLLLSTAILFSRYYTWVPRVRDASASCITHHASAFGPLTPRSALRFLKTSSYERKCLTDTNHRTKLYIPNGYTYQGISSNGNGSL